MAEEKDSWGEYSKLVLKELERLNENYSSMKSDIDTRFTELNVKLNKIENIEGKLSTQSSWIDRVNDVWSPSQMKEAKDEIYKQKSRWVAAIAILSFVQILVGTIIAIWSKIH